MREAACGIGSLPQAYGRTVVSGARARLNFRSRTVSATNPHLPSIRVTRPSSCPVTHRPCRSPASSVSASACASSLRVSNSLDAPGSFQESSQRPHSQEAPRLWGPGSGVQTRAVAAAAYRQPGPEVEGILAAEDATRGGGEEGISTGVAGSLGGGKGEEPQAKRNKSSMAVLSVAEGAVSAAGTEGVLHLQSQKAAQAWAAQQQQQGGQEHSQSRQQGAGAQDTKQQSASPPFIQGPLAALRGYLLSTSGRAMFAVGSFGARQGQPSTPNVARPGGQDLPPLPTPRPGAGALSTPSRGAVATRALPPHGPGAWWSESSEDVGPTVSDALGATPSESAAPRGGGTAGASPADGGAAAEGRQEGVPQAQTQLQGGDGGIVQEPRGAPPAATASASAGAGVGAGLSASASRSAAQGQGGELGGTASASSAPREGSGFVNEGLLRWQERRAAWRAGRSAGSPSATAGSSPSPAGTGTGAGPATGGGSEQHPHSQHQGQHHGHHHRQRRRPADQFPKIRPGTTYEDILSSSKPFPEPVPLPEMVEFLVQVWKEEGLYD